jgi:hypothetical protein
VAKSNTFRAERAKELLTLKDLLRQVMPIVPASIDALSTAATTCRLSKNDLWHYEVTNLVFPRISVHRSGVRHSRPAIEEYEVALTVNAFGTCTEEDSLSDPLSDLNVDIVVNGYTKRKRQKINALHLDSHPPRTEKERLRQPVPDLIEAYTTSGKRVNNIHPRYHFQIGGKHVWDKPSYEFGSQLILETPRIAHPPLDAILAIDFVLANYYAETWTNLLKADNRYSDLVETAQEIFWRPYLFAAASTWNPYSVASPRWLPQQTYFCGIK